KRDLLSSLLDVHRVEGTSQSLPGGSQLVDVAPFCAPDLPKELRVIEGDRVQVLVRATKQPLQIQEYDYSDLPDAADTPTFYKSLRSYRGFYLYVQAREARTGLGPPTPVDFSKEAHGLGFQFYAGSPTVSLSDLLKLPGAKLGRNPDGSISINFSLTKGL